MKVEVLMSEMVDRQTGQNLEGLTDCLRQLTAYRGDSFIIVSGGDAFVQFAPQKGRRLWCETTGNRFLGEGKRLAKDAISRLSSLGFRESTARQKARGNFYRLYEPTVKMAAIADDAVTILTTVYGSDPAKLEFELMVDEEPAASFPARVVLRDGRDWGGSRFLTAELKPSGDLELAGHDMGRAVEEFFHRDEYEYWRVVKKPEVRKVVAALRQDAGLEDEVAFKKWLEDTDAPQGADWASLFLVRSRFKDEGRFSDWLEKKGIPSEIHNWY
jgi:T3SS (YopN, CesT) and YbjN peptide-binding chaperone 3